MEKRLFLAVGLSIAVVFIFQGLFGPKGAPQRDLSQLVDDNGVASKTSADTLSKQTSPATSKNTEGLVKEKTFSVNTGDFTADFSNNGGNLQGLTIKKFDYVVPLAKLINIKEYENKAFSYDHSFTNEHSFIYEDQDWRIVKTYAFEKNGIFKALLKITNVSGEAKPFGKETDFFVIDISRLDKNYPSADRTLLEYTVKNDKKIIRKSNVNNFNEKWNKEEALKIEWMAFRDRYFVTTVRPQQALDKYSVKMISNEALSLGSPLSSEMIDAGTTKTYEFTLYSGPQDAALLKLAGGGVEKVWAYSDWGWLDAISKFIDMVMGLIHKVVPVWGLCIILISLIIYGATYPLTAKSLVSMKKMQTLQPKMAELKKKHAKSPEKLNQEVVELYRRNGVNPLSGCLPMLLQMPIFVGLYQVLWRSIYFRGEGFLWIKDLSMPDRLFKFPFNIPVLGEYFNILPIIMAVVMFVQQKMNLQSGAGADPEQQAQQKMLAIFMPVFLGFIFYSFSSGLNLYFVVFYLLSTVTQWKISKDMKPAI